MIINILSIIVFTIFLTLGSIHFYWAFGGKWAIKNAIPTKKENENIDFKPSAFATLFVGIVLTAFSSLYLVQTSFITTELPKWTNFFLWIVPSLFLVRAIGDFKYVGFFKKVKSTVFAKWDDKLYSPLCLIISALGFSVILFH